eukprot:jgi/Mesen1/7053/ME000369S06371
MFQFYHRINVNLQRRLYGHDLHVDIKPLNEERAVETAADTLGETVVFGVGIGALIFEWQRGVRSDQRKVEAQRQLDLAQDGRIEALEKAISSGSSWKASREVLKRDAKIEAELQALKQEIEFLKKSLQISQERERGANLQKPPDTGLRPGAEQTKVIEKKAPGSPEETIHRGKGDDGEKGSASGSGSWYFFGGGNSSAKNASRPSNQSNFTADIALNVFHRLCSQKAQQMSPFLAH